MDRREFVKSSALSAGVVLAAGGSQTHEAAGANAAPTGRLPDLAPARWVWYPSGRTLPNTFILFRRELELAAPPRRAVGWIAADSRYRLEVNGGRVQWGPAPADPRWAEADPVDLTGFLRAGRNVIGATVLYYGHGDGTWPLGRPGFLFRLEVEHADGRREVAASDASWRCLLADAWPPGQYKRWYLRALQEEFDARKYPHGWTTADFPVTRDWLAAQVLPGSPQKPALADGYPDALLDTGGGPPDAALRPRTIPLLRETLVPVDRLAESHRLEWLRPPREYFALRVPDAFRVDRRPCATAAGPGRWQVQADGTRGSVLTFELAEQVVGWPFFTIEAPAGTVVELLVHEAHEVGGPPLLNTHFDSWARFTCREGVNRFETFDFESLRWLQLHVHPTPGPVDIRDVGVRRRQFPWPHDPVVRTSEPALQRLFDASVNTLHNCAQETLVDGMARERQQYSGDGAHQMHAVVLAFGETRLPARFLTTVSQGLTKDGFFLDCWPAYDRLARLMERQLDLTGWGPILDHGVQFFLDGRHYWLYTADRGPFGEVLPRLVRFAGYLKEHVGPHGLLPVEDLGVPSVWIDHNAYLKQAHKQCAFNLYAAAALEHGLAPLAGDLGDAAASGTARELGRRLREAAVARFWDADRGLFVVNRPWLAQEKEPRLCDRSLATAVLFDQCPGGRTGPAVRALAEVPPEMGLSYPCNAGWRLWALARAGRADVVVDDLRKRWAVMDSVRLNNTLQEDWTARPDSGQQWSHCAVVPLYVAFLNLAGIRPLEPGFARAEIRPQLADLPDLDLAAHTVRGPIRFTGRGPRGDRRLALAIPAGCQAELVLPREEKPALPPAEGPAPAGQARYRLPVGSTELTLKTG